MSFHLAHRSLSLFKNRGFYQRCIRFKSNDAPISENVTQVPMSRPLQNFPNIVYAKVASEDNETKVTRLSNGLQVASLPRFGQFCTVGVAINSGSRYEADFPSGISHFLDKLAFQSTSEFNSKEEILAEFEKNGGIVDCQSSRDRLIYATSIDTRGLDIAIKILSEVILRPRITEQEIDFARQTVDFELQDIYLRPDQEMTLLEMIHAAAFKGNTLGLPRLCPQENIQKITRDDILSFISTYHTPDRMVVAGVGVDHRALVEYSQKYFVERKPIWIGEAKPKTVDTSRAQYTGGLEIMEKDLSDVAPGQTPIPELAHIVIGLESVSNLEIDDFVATCVLNMMMGGGGSFSAGGPGKGMYTRLYTNVLNRYHWMYNATAYSHSYNDGGLFCIHASANPAQIEELVTVIVREMVNMPVAIGDVEFQRAKTQLKSMLLMNLEARPVVFEDIAQQVLLTGKHRLPRFFMEKIDSVSEEDIRRVAFDLLKSNVSVAALGDVQKLPSFEDIRLGISSKDGRMPKRFTLFR